MSSPRAATSVATSTSEGALAEPVHDPIALLLAHAAVQGRRVVAAAGQRLRQLVHFQPGACEDQRRGGILQVQDPRQRGELVGAAHDVHALPDAGHLRARWPFGAHGHPDRLPEMASRDPRDRGRDRGREERGLASRRGRGEERLEVFGEAHVEHLVGLVEHDGLHGVEGEAAASQVVHGPAGGGDHHVDPAPERPELLADRLAAVDRKDVGIHATTISVDGLRDLHRQLARGDQDERERPARARPPQAPAGGEPLQDREREGGRLAGPRGRLRQHIAPGEEGRDRLELDRRRLLVPQPLEGCEQGRGQPERRETARLGGRRWGRRIERGGGVGHPHSLRAGNEWGTRPVDRPGSVKATASGCGASSCSPRESAPAVRRACRGTRASSRGRRAGRDRSRHPA